MSDSPAEQAIAACARGAFVIIVDDEAPAAQGDLMLAAEHLTTDALNFVLREARGPVYVPLTAARLDRLLIPLLTPDTDKVERAAMCVPVDARECAAGGASVGDRVTTIRRLASPEAGTEDFVRPGHVTPLRARPGGVLQRAGHTEAAVDLARLAGCEPAGVICPVLRDDGALATRPELLAFADRHRIPIVTTKDLIRHRSRTERLIVRDPEAEAFLPTEHGDFRLISYGSLIDGTAYVALVMGDVAGADNVLVRVHSGCLTGDVFHSLRCDCGRQLGRAMQMIAAEGRGVVVYVQSHEGRGIGLHNKVRAYHLQDRGADTVEANELLGFPPDFRDYGVGAQVLVDLGVTTMRLLTNNPRKLVALEGYGLKVVERVPIEIEPTPHSQRYLATKRDKLGHLLRAKTQPEDEQT